MDYFDLQVNGYGGVDFNQDDLSADGMRYGEQEEDDARGDEVGVHR